MVGPGDRNEELRYSLRSLAAHVPHDRVWIAGHCPPWVTGVHHIPVPQNGRSRFANSTANMRAACEHPDVSDTFAYFNDDFFVLRDLPDGVPVLHRGPVADVVAATPHSAYRMGAIATARLLRHLGYPEPLSYELHMPMTVHRAGMLEAIERGRNLPVMHKRTLYGNLAGIGGEQVPDCKIVDRNAPIPAGVWCVSTSDQSFAAGLVGRQVRDMFGEPCRYEREGA